MIRSNDGGNRSRAETFRLNFRRELARSGLSLAELANRSGVAAPTLRRWYRLGTSKPGHANLAAVAQTLAIEDPWTLFAPRQTASRATHAVDQATNPAIEEVLRRRPDLFDRFTPEDWDELYSLHGTGGPLTHEGVHQAAARLRAKRDLREKFETLLDTHFFHTLTVLIDLMHRDASVP